MRLPAAIALLMGVYSAAAQAAAPAEPQGDRPAEPQLAAAERTAAAARIKRVLLLRDMRMCAERHRYTPENLAESVALARQLGAPAELVALLQRESEGGLSGRAHYDHRQEMADLLRAYGVDSLSIRLFAEAMRYPQEELRKVVDALPLEAVFNLLPAGAPAQETLDHQCELLAKLSEQMLQIYSEVQSREQARAAAEKLLPLLREHDRTLQLRARLGAKRMDDLPERYARVLLPQVMPLVQHRRRLQEAAYYGSPLLAALDYLLGS